jgi:hypothetical protein
MLLNEKCCLEIYNAAVGCAVYAYCIYSVLHNVSHKVGMLECLSS